eukprot:bmy_20010T0
MDPVSLGNEHYYLCTVICESQKLEEGIPVEIYSFPKDPEIHLSGSLEVGKPVTVTCLVPAVYPFEKLEIELLKGNRSVKTQNFLEPSEMKSQETKSLEVTFTPIDEDIGKDLVCQATVHINEIDSQPQVRETTKKLQVYVSRKDTVISVNPSTSLQEDVSKKSLETKSLEMTFIPTTEDTGKVLVCLAKLPIDEMELEPKQRQSTQVLYVNVAPGDTTLLVSPSSILEEGRSVNMTCSSDGLLASKILWSRLLSNGDLQPLSENITLTLTSTKMEDSGIYVCEDINQVGISRKEVKLIIQVAPKDIQLNSFSF